MALALLIPRGDSMLLRASIIMRDGRKVYFRPVTVGLLKGNF